MYVYVRACDYTTLSATRLEAYDLKIVPCHTMQKRGRQAQDSKSGASNCAYSHSSEATTTFPAACLARGHFDQMQTLARDEAKGCECKGEAEGGKGKGAAEGDIGTPPPPFLCLGDLRGTPRDGRGKGNAEGQHGEEAKAGQEAKAKQVHQFCGEGKAESKDKAMAGQETVAEVHKFCKHGSRSRSRHRHSRSHSRESDSSDWSVAPLTPHWVASSPITNI